jgi:hypothetical protein
MTRDEQTEDVLRRCLASRPRPRQSTDFAGAVLRRVATGPTSSERRSHDGRALLGVYWLVASLGSVALLHRMSWPSWAPSALGPAALALVPLGYAAFLWADRLAEWVALLLRPLLAEPTPERD